MAGRGLFCDLTEVAVDDIAAAKSVNDFYKKAKKQYPQVPQEILQQIYEAAALKHADTFRSVGAVKADIGRAVAQEAWDRSPTLQKAVKAVNAVWNLPRGATTPGDVPVFRQGGIPTMTHPLISARALGKTLKTLKILKGGGEEARQALDIRMRTADPELFNKMVDAEVYVQPFDRHAPLEAREEAYINTALESVPGIGKFYRGSETVFATYMNLVRYELFKHHLENFQAKEGRVPSGEELKALGAYINTATGRGSLGKLEAAAPILNQFLFSAKYAMSRLEFLSGKPLWGEKMQAAVDSEKPATTTGRLADKRAMQKVIGREYARYYASVAGTLAMTKLIAAQYPGSVQVQDDPRSSDFGKIRIGNTRFDLGSGLNQYITFAARLATGKTYQAGKAVPLGERPSGSPHETPTRADLAEQQLRRKLAPTPGLIVSMASNKQLPPQRRAPSWQGPQIGVDAVGGPVTIPSALMGLTVPMSIPDILEAAKEDGIPMGIAVAAANLASMSTSTYPDRAGQKKR